MVGGRNGAVCVLEVGLCGGMTQCGSGGGLGEGGGVGGTGGGRERRVGARERVRREGGGLKFQVKLTPLCINL